MSAFGEGASSGDGGGVDDNDVEGALSDVKRAAEIMSSKAGALPSAAERKALAAMRKEEARLQALSDARMEKVRERLRWFSRCLFFVCLTLERRFFHFADEGGDDGKTQGLGEQHPGQLRTEHGQLCGCSGPEDGGV